jgi:hypothetical protein
MLIIKSNIANNQVAHCKGPAVLRSSWQLNLPSALPAHGVSGGWFVVGGVLG